MEKSPAPPPAGRAVPVLFPSGPRWSFINTCGIQAAELFLTITKQDHKAFVCGPIISLVRQSFSALGSSASEHLATIFSFHSLAEAMLLLSLKLLGLIGSKHQDTLLSKRNLARI